MFVQENAANSSTVGAGGPSGGRGPGPIDGAGGGVDVVDGVVAVVWDAGADVSGVEGALADESVVPSDDPHADTTSANTIAHLMVPLVMRRRVRGRDRVCRWATVLAHTEVATGEGGDRTFASSYERGIEAACCSRHGSPRSRSENRPSSVFAASSSTAEDYHSRMTTQAVDAVRIIHGHLRTVLTGLTDDEWAEPSACEGWRVQDVLAHVTSNQKEFVDPTPAPDEPMPAMTAEQAMEALVAPRKDWTSSELLAEYDRYADAWFGVLDAMQAEPTASTEGPLADLGTYPMHMVANAFAFDHYCHLRVDLLQPTGPLAADIGEVTDDELRPGIEWMLAGIPQMQPGVLPPVVTRPLGLRLTGPGGGEWTISPSGEGDDGELTIAEGIAVDAAATVESSAHDFVRWGTQRCDWRDCSTVTGDEAYAAVVLDTLNIV